MFIPTLGLSLAAAGAIAMAFQVANSVAQMVFGPLADRWRRRAFIIGGPFVAVAVLSLAGLATSAMTLGLIVIGLVGDRLGLGPTLALLALLLALAAVLTMALPPLGGITRPTDLHPSLRAEWHRAVPEIPCCNR